ncbi:MAG: hypothetical protein KJ598_00365 [Nanoarchaeota archaeon]|nr:hypothetical protein [Nanoarchaeota archaeon]MBU1643591.1 hypothetical protein [Nanoarchaeota archaeon]
MKSRFFVLLSMTLVISLFLVGCTTSIDKEGNLIGEAWKMTKAKTPEINRCNIGDICEDIYGLKDKAEDTKQTFGELDGRIEDLKLEVKLLKEMIQDLHPNAFKTLEK